MRRADRRTSCLAMTSPLIGAHDDPVAAADRRGGRDDHLIAVAEHRFHGIAADFQGVGVRIGDFRQADLIPAAADRVAAVVEIAGAAGLGEADQRDPPWPCACTAFGDSARVPVTSAVKASRLAPVAFSTLATLSVLGQRLRPSGIRRLDG